MAEAYNIRLGRERPDGKTEFYSMHDGEAYFAKIIYALMAASNLNRNVRLGQSLWHVYVKEKPFLFLI